MKYYQNILETIGNTPLIALHTLSKRIKPLVLVKVESFNPGGSSKDRVGIRMIEAAEKAGLLRPGGTIVEPTSGNTGVGLAIAAAIKGYKVIFTMPDKMSAEKESLLRAYGAKVIRTPTAVAPEDPQSYYSVAKRLVQEIPGAFSPNQYFNENNPLAHYMSTGPEIWRDTDGRVTHFVAGMGTGGTISGVARFLKENNSSVRVIGADPEGSVYHEEFFGTQGKIHPYLTQGIGEDFMPSTMDLSLVDDIVIVDDKDALLMTRRIVQEEGILVGESSGAVLHAALEYAKGLSEDDVVVVLLPDTGRNYLSTTFNDSWMEEQGFLNPLSVRKEVVIEVKNEI